MWTAIGFVFLALLFIGLPALVIDGILFQTLSFEIYNSKKGKTIRLVSICIAVAFTLYEIATIS